MSDFDRQPSHDIQDMPAGSKVISASGTTTLMPYEQTVYIDSDLGAVTVELPNPAECAGRLYSIRVPDVDTGEAGATTVATRVAVGLANATLDADNDHELLYSDGRRFLRVVNGVA